MPESLLKRVRIFCVQEERSIMIFVAEAIREKLTRDGRKLAMLASLFAA